MVIIWVWSFKCHGSSPSVSTDVSDIFSNRPVDGLQLRRLHGARGAVGELASTIVFAAAIGGLIGARFLFIVEEWQEFLAAPMSYIFTVAGFTWYGGFFGVGAGLRRRPDRLSLRR